MREIIFAFVMIFLFTFVIKVKAETIVLKEMKKCLIAIF